MTRAQQREYHALQRRLRKDHERLQREQPRAQRFLPAREPPLVDLGLAEPIIRNNYILPRDMLHSVSR